LEGVPKKRRGGLYSPRTRKVCETTSAGAGGEKTVEESEVKNSRLNPVIGEVLRGTVKPGVPYIHGKKRPSGELMGKKGGKTRCRSFIKGEQKGKRDNMIKDYQGAKWASSQNKMPSLE